MDATRIEDLPAEYRRYGDGSIGPLWDAIHLPAHELDERLVQILDSVVPLSLVSGLWHRQSKQVEVICKQSSLKGKDLNKDLEIEFRGEIYRTRFAPASSALREIASRHIVAPGGDEHRVARALRELKDEVGPQQSFWMGPLASFDDEHVTELAEHLNFYLRLFDPDSITISTDAQRRGRVAYPRLFDSPLPSPIQSAQIPTFVLKLWYASLEGGDYFRRFLEAFRVLEYTAPRLAERTVIEKIRRAASSDDALAVEGLRFLGKIRGNAVNVVNSLRVAEASHDPMLRAMLRRAIGDRFPHWRHRVWDFDGLAKPAGPVVNCIAEGAHEIEESDAEQIIKGICAIRNSIVHFDEHDKAIRPTSKNNQMLAEWLPVLNALAMWTMDRRAGSSTKSPTPPASPP